MFDLVVKDLNSMQEVLSSIIFSIVKQKYIYHVIVNLSWCFYFKTYHVKALLSCPFFTPQPIIQQNIYLHFIACFHYLLFSPSSSSHLNLFFFFSKTFFLSSLQIHSFIHTQHTNKWLLLCLKLSLKFKL
jgi:hypothetical protein